MKHRYLLFLCCIAFLHLTSAAQEQQQTAAPSGASLAATVLSPDSLPVSGAKVTLCTTSCLTATTNDGGYFQFHEVAPGAYTLQVTADGFDAYKQTLQVGSDPFVPVADIQLKLPTVETTVNALTQREQAELELRAETSQRVLGFIPNYYVSYEEHPAPLTSGQKYHLALKSLFDPVTFAFDAGLAGYQQKAGIYAGDRRPDGSYTGWGQGPESYGKRYGAAVANTFSATLLGNAVFPSLFHQDPRYIYQGKGTVRSRFIHAVSSSLITPADNGRNQINYSYIVGNFTAAGLSNLYYPASDRGLRLTIINGLVNSAGASVLGLAEEFILPKFTSRGRKE